MKLYSFDPGETTGVCIFRCDSQHHAQIWTLQGTAEFPMFDGLREFELAPVDTVLIESVNVIAPRMKIAPVIVRGAIEHWCSLKGVVPVHQMPTLLAAARIWYKNLPDKLRRHERDAVHHALMYFGSLSDRQKVEYFGNKLSYFTKGGLIR